MRISFENEVEQLEYEISGLKKASKEPAFAQYLCSVESRLIGNPQDVNALRLEMIKNYNTYVDRMMANGVHVAPNFHEAVYPGMEAPAIVPSQDNKDKSDMLKASDKQDFVYEISGQNASAPIAPVMSTPANAPVPNVPMQGMPVQNVPAPNVPMQGMPVQNVQVPNVPMQGMPVQNVTVPNVPVQNIPKASNMQSNAAPAKQAPANKNRAEFAIGGIVLSVLGTVLILTGAIMLAVNFFDTTWQGISLYAVCVALFLFSELFIRRFVDKLSAVLTSLAIGGTFVVTLVNYFALHIYNMPVTLIILILLSIAIGVYSYFRNSFLFSLIGYFASYTILSLISQATSETEIYMIYGIMMASGLLWTIFPIKKNGRAFSIIQVFANIFLVFWYLPAISGFIAGNDCADWLRCLILTSVSYAIFAVMILLNGLKYYKDAFADSEPSYSANLTFYKVMLIVANVVYAFILLISLVGIEEQYLTIGLIISGCAVIIPNAIAAYILYVKDSSLWSTCVFTAAFTGVTCLGWREGMWGAVIVCFFIMAAVSMLTYFKKTTTFNVVDLLLKIYLFVIMFAQIANADDPYVMRYVCIAGILIAIGMASGYKLPIQIMMTGLLTIDVCTLVPEQTIPVAITLILAIAVGLFHNVEWFKSKNMYAFDIPVWITLLVTVFCLYIPTFRDELATVILTMIFGLAIMIQYYFKRYNTFLSGKMLPLGIFITLFVPVFRMENLVVSIILMSLALLCVALGFIFKQKGIRIYGLVLAILVCAKIGFYDFWSADSLIKTIMFFVVGILSLVIAGVYIVVEKKMSKQDKVD